MILHSKNRGQKVLPLTNDQIIRCVVEGRKKPLVLAMNTCTCGCGSKLNGKSLFLQGHDAKLKSFLRQVLDGRESADKIPIEVIQRRDIISFLKIHPELKGIIPSDVLPEGGRTIQKEKGKQTQCRQQRKPIYGATTRWPTLPSTG